MKHDEQFVYSWGSGGHGQLGHGNIEDYDYPKLLSASSFNNLKDSLNLCSLTTGGCHSAVIHKNGNLYTWGDNTYGQLGYNPDNNETTQTELIKLPYFSNKKVLSVACGWWHTIVITEDISENSYENDTRESRVFSWGCGKHGQLGISNDTTDIQYYPLEISSFKNYVISSVACGWKHSLAVSHNGEVFSWGYGRKGQLGLGEDIKSCLVPKSITFPVPIIGVQSFCGWEHSAVLTSDEKIWTWGINKHGQLGLGEEMTQSFVPKLIQLTEVSQLACGWHHFICLQKCGALYSWGKGSHGQLGHDNTTSYNIPTEIKDIQNLLCISQISCGSEHSSFVTENGELYCWGWNEHGNIGNQTHENVLKPLLIQISNDNSNLFVQSVITGGAGTIAITKTE